MAAAFAPAAWNAPAIAVRFRTRALRTKGSRAITREPHAVKAIGPDIQHQRVLRTMPVVDEEGALAHVRDLEERAACAVRVEWQLSRMVTPGLR